MLIGSLDIEISTCANTSNTSAYNISNLPICITHPMFFILFQSFNVSSIFTDQDSNNNDRKKNNINTDHNQFRLPYIKSIMPLDDFIRSTTCTIEVATTLFQSMYSQLQFLLENNIAISFIEMTDIMVIDGQFFYFCNYNKLFTIGKDMTILVTDFYDSRNPYLPPEFVQNIRIPFHIHYTSAFYSLAIIVLYCLYLSNSNLQIKSIKSMNSTHTTNQINVTSPTISRSHMLKNCQDVLSLYEHTKLYQTLNLCMMNEPKRRKLFLF